ncbi:hypothetical protein GB2207_00060 [marine gamma proteobacterium HTCC2207]|uniref:Uncharacterized protein n=1 Tax=gamma proteobacterium HTCC2207 TaxID=314287 RepID=Q1YQC4_9GAMM|nr:hypothetical protein GB2207_00060 [marine gamma proteobacterium HTCC2207] [gamma proteobacterium HTCC2207]
MLTEKIFMFKKSLSVDIEEYFTVDVFELQIETFVIVSDIIDYIQLTLSAQPSLAGWQRFSAQILFS